MAYRKLQLDTNDEDESTADDGVQALKDWFARFTVEYPGEASLVQDLYEYVIGMRSSRPDSHDLFQGR